MDLHVILMLCINYQLALLYVEVTHLPNRQIKKVPAAHTFDVRGHVKQKR